MKKSIESQIKTIRFDVERLYAIVKEDLIDDFVRLSAIETANKLIHELVILGSDEQR